MPESLSISPTLRPAAPDDWPALVAMDQSVFGWYGADEDPAVIRARLEIFPQGCVVLEEATVEGETTLLGYLTTEKWDDFREPVLGEDPRATHQPDGDVLNITTLAVGIPYQNRGLGGLLLDAAFAIARREGCRGIILETARAQRFYLRHGFETVAERSQRGIPLFVMRYLLSEA